MAKRQTSAVLDLIKVADKAPSNLELFSISRHFTNQGLEHLAKNSVKKNGNYKKILNY